MGFLGNRTRPVERSVYLTFECVCDERIIILGLNEDWFSEQRANFECGCGQILTLANRLKEEVFEFGQLVRGIFKRVLVRPELIPCGCYGGCFESMRVGYICPWNIVLTGRCNK
jgi:hypothetical protein